ncbi:hypothetical protein PQX77_003095, partial [Marasmius sp. AFHP31]
LKILKPDSSDQAFLFIWSARRLTQLYAVGGCLYVTKSRGGTPAKGTLRGARVTKAYALCSSRSFMLKAAEYQDWEGYDHPVATVGTMIPMPPWVHDCSGSEEYMNSGINFYGSALFAVVSYVGLSMTSKSK